MADCNERAEQRASLRHIRHSLTQPQKLRAAKAIAQHLGASGHLRPNQCIAGYIAMTDEIDCSLALQNAVRHGCKIFFPRILVARKRTMIFAPPTALWRLNRYSILEPNNYLYHSSRWCNLILLPLLGFDAQGNRLGLGAGFYDRALAFRRLRREWLGPLLIGIAHSSQEVAKITSLPTDIPLDAVLTEKGIRYF